MSRDNAILTIKDWYDITSGKPSIRHKKSFGSTNPKLVREAIAREERWLKRKV